MTFEWRVDDQAQTQESELIARVERRSLLQWLQRFSRRTWITLLIIFVILPTAAFSILYIRYQRALYQIEIQIQDVIDQEANAYARGNVRRFMAQQDSDNWAWAARQAQRVSPVCDETFKSFGPAYPWHSMKGDKRNYCAPALPAQVLSVDLRDDIAWIEVLESDPPRRRVRFYRRTDLGWRHTAPLEDFWRAPRSKSGQDVIIRYHKRDEPAIRPALELILNTVEEVRQDVLYFAWPGKLEIVFDTTAPTIFYPDFEQELINNNRLNLSSPWLTGLNQNGTLNEVDLDQIKEWVAYGVMLHSLQSHLSPQPSQLQRAIADEYTAWYISGDLAQAPLLSRLIERHGKEILPRALWSLRGNRLQALFMIQWLSLSPERDQWAFFDALLDIERQALLNGRQDTWLLIQQSGRWRDAQAAFFERYHTERPGLEVMEINIRRIKMGDRWVLLTLQADEALQAGEKILLPGMILQEGETQAYALFVVDEFDWKRTSLTSQDLAELLGE